MFLNKSTEKGTIRNLINQYGTIQESANLSYLNWNLLKQHPAKLHSTKLESAKAPFI